MNVRVTPVVYPLEIQPSSHVITCGSDQTLLDGCIQAGIPAPYNCRSGECGECKATLLSGEVSREIRDLLIQRGVIVVRGLEMRDEDQRAFTQTLGKRLVQTIRQSADAQL